MYFLKIKTRIKQREEVFMRNLLKFGFTLLGIVMIASYVEAVTVVKTQSAPKYNYYDSRSDMFDYDLDRIERKLFRKTYSSNNLQVRLNRIERKVFNRCFPNWNPTRRLNHILANYRDDDNSYIVQEQYNRRPIQRVRNRIIGQPTGFTPSFMDMPFGSSFGRGFGPGYNQSFGTNTGYGFLNSIPAMTGAGIKILD